MNAFLQVLGFHKRKWLLLLLWRREAAWPWCTSGMTDDAHEAVRKDMGKMISAG